MEQKNEYLTSNAKLDDNKNVYCGNAAYTNQPQELWGINRKPFKQFCWNSRSLTHCGLMHIER